MSTTTSKHINVLAIGYGRQLFTEGNPERQRMEACAAAVGECHLIVFTNAHDNLPPTIVGNLHLHPTAARTKLGQLFRAIKLGLQVIRTSTDHWVVTSQDPFEAGLVGYVIARWRRVPLNVQEHGDFFSTVYWRRDAFLNRLRYWFGRWLLRHADSVRVVSKRIKATMVRLGVSSNRIYTLPVRSDQTKPGNVVPYDYGFGADALVVLTMARLVRQKNLPLLLTSFASVVTTEPKAQLVVVGSGPETDRLAQLATRLGIAKQVTFIPWTDNPAAHYQAADIFALSSDWEGWARTLVEAMSYGLPIVTTDVGCAGEVVLNERHGFVVPVGDVTTFTDKLRTLVSDATLRTQFGRQAQSDAAKEAVSLASYATDWATVLCDTQTARRR